jgi:class 3 adenylate cyclase
VFNFISSGVTVISILFARLALLCFLLNGLSALAQTTPVQVRQGVQSIDLTADGLLLEDPEGKLSLDDVRSNAVGPRFKRGSFTPGFTPSTFWFRFTLRSEASAPAMWWLESGDRFMQEVDLFSPDANGVYQRQSASSTRPFSERPLPTGKFVFPISLEPGKTVEIFIRARPMGFMPVAFYPSLWTPEAHKEAAKRAHLQWIFYAGMAAALMSFNFLLYLFIRDRNYLFYVLAQTSMAWWVGTSRFGSGVAFEFLWPASPLFDQIALPLSCAATIYFAYLFQSRLIELPSTRPDIDRYWKLIVWMLMVCFGLSALGILLPQLIPVYVMQSAFRSSTFGGILFMSCNAYAVYALARSGSRTAKVLATAWLPSIFILSYPLSLAYFSIRVDWIIPPLMLASSLEMLLMSLALADRINQARKEKARAQAEMVTVLQRSERELENTVVQRTEELRKEQARAKELLHNILPAGLADELSATGKASSARHESVTVMFTDFIQFTQTASTIPADRLVAELNEIFGAFDDICDELGVEKIKTIGDSYMAAAGLPTPCADHAQRCVRAGLRMVEYLEQRNRKAAFKWALRVGVHSGPVVAGVVGKRKYAFDIWGDAVNLASRIESSGEVGRVNVSAYTYDLIQKDFECAYRGKVNAKGKGEIDMYFVTGTIGQGAAQ